FSDSKHYLMEKLGEKFSPYLYNKDAGPYIVIVISTTVKEFRGEVSFSTTYASKIYVNLDIDYVRSLVQNFTPMSIEVQVTGSSNVASIHIVEEMVLNQMDIKELFESA
ncbi:Coatomer subunit gamma-2, partial [Datura stramonium]|nr:Coatomer subunit gamma-2 [Datura stramonium]